MLGECVQFFFFQAEDGIRDELDALRFVELVGGADQAEVTLVDQIGERDALVLILLRDRHHEPEVGAHQFVERLRVALLDSLSERHFLLTGDQRVLADLAEVLVERSLVEGGPFGRVQLHGGFTPPGMHDAARDGRPAAPTARSEAAALLSPATSAELPAQLYYATLRSDRRLS